MTRRQKALAVLHPPCPPADENGPREIKVQVGFEMFRFHSFSNWCNKARDWFAARDDIPSHRRICVDQFGRICSSGAEFIRASDEGAFPVVVYSLDVPEVGK